VSGTADTSAGIIKSQPTRFRGWREMIRAAIMDKKTGSSNRQPSALAHSAGVGLPVNCTSQITSPASDPTQHKTAGSQANMALRLTFSDRSCAT
jgi:hypothetical protein